MYLFKNYSKLCANYFFKVNNSIDYTIIYSFIFPFHYNFLYVSIFPSIYQFLFILILVFRKFQIFTPKIWKKFSNFPSGPMIGWLGFVAYQPL